MRLLADMHIAPRTVAYLRSLGHDVRRVDELLPATAIVALSGRIVPSVISLQLSSPRVERVNAVLAEVLPTLEQDLRAGAIVTVEDARVRRRRLPL